MSTFSETFFTYVHILASKFVYKQILTSANKHPLKSSSYLNYQQI